MRRIGKHHFRQPFFHDHAAIHENHAVGRLSACGGLQFGAGKAAVFQHRQLGARMGQACRVQVGKQERRRFAGAGADHAERVHHHAHADIAHAALTGRHHVGGVLQRPRRDQHVPVHLFECPLTQAAGSTNNSAPSITRRRAISGKRRS